MFKDFVLHINRNDLSISKLIEKYGDVDLKESKHKFKSLVNIIVSQQLSTSSAQKIFNKLASRLNNNFDPNLVLNLNDQDFKEIGLSKQKIKYIKGLSSEIIKKELVLDDLKSKPDKLIHQRLLKLNGFGNWSADIFLLFGLGRENVLVSSDYGIRKAIQSLYKLKQLPSPEQVFKIAKEHQWEPYCSYVCLYLWKSLENSS